LPGSISSALNVFAVSPKYGVDGTLLLGSASNGIYESTNRCSSWVSVTAATVEIRTPAAVPAKALWSELKPGEKASEVTAGDACVVELPGRLPEGATASAPMEPVS
jgi:hypothetical protein